MSGIFLDEMEIHKVAYLTAKGWVPAHVKSDGRCSWEFESKEDSELNAWYLDIDDAYACQRERDGFPVEDKDA